MTYWICSLAEPRSGKHTVSKRAGAPEPRRAIFRIRKTPAELAGADEVIE
jgi:hypothetical protein